MPGRIIWTQETGWTDGGPEAVLTLDENGHVVIVSIEQENEK